MQLRTIDLFFVVGVLFRSQWGCSKKIKSVMQRSPLESNDIGFLVFLGSFIHDVTQIEEGGTIV